MLFRVYDENNELVFEGDDSDNCRARETGDLCGGCTACLLQQASYSGFRVEKVPAPRPTKSFNKPRNKEV